MCLRCPQTPSRANPEGLPMCEYPRLPKGTRGVTACEEHLGRGWRDTKSSWHELPAYLGRGESHVMHPVPGRV